MSELEIKEMIHDYVSSILSDLYDNEDEKESAINEDRIYDDLCDYLFSDNCLDQEIKNKYAKLIENEINESLKHV